MLRIEVWGVLTCASAVAEAARDAGWATAYDRVSGAAQHLCPRHRDPVGGRAL